MVIFHGDKLFNKQCILDVLGFMVTSPANMVGDWHWDMFPRIFWWGYPTIYSMGYLAKDFTEI